MFLPAAPQRARQRVQNAWERDQHGLDVSRIQLDVWPRIPDQNAITLRCLWQSRTDCCSACKLPSHDHNDQ